MFESERVDSWIKSLFERYPSDLGTSLRNSDSESADINPLKDKKLRIFSSEETVSNEAQEIEIHVTHAFFVKQFLYRMRSLEEGRKPIHYLSMTKFLVARGSGTILLELQNESDLYESYQRSRLESL